MSLKEVEKWMTLRVVDAYESGVGAVLLQARDDGLQPIAFFSAKFQPHQKAYSTIEKEALVLVLALDHFDVYVGQNSQSGPVDGTLSLTSSNIELVNETRQETKIKKTVIDLLRTPVMRMRSLNMFFCWVVCTLVYYGLSSTTISLGGNIFVNFIAMMLVEIPSYVFTFLVLDRLGRKASLSFMFLLGGVTCFISGFIHEGKLCECMEYSMTTPIPTHTFIHTYSSIPLPTHKHTHTLQ
nr:solute carrier family 22 member 1-like [Cherax quadricarinatus]